MKKISLSRTYKDLEIVLYTLDKDTLGCEGMTYVIHYILSMARIEHTCMVGSAINKKNNKVVFPHCWIVIDDHIIDFRLRWWLGDHNYVPHGIFNKKNKTINYLGMSKEFITEKKLVTNMLDRDISQLLSHVKDIMRRDN